MKQDMLPSMKEIGMALNHKLIHESFSNKPRDFLKLMEASAACRHYFEWDKWMNEIPWLNFPTDLIVQIIPPYNGAMIRFLVKKPGMKRNVSVYLDCYTTLGFYNNVPYWEIYPWLDGDVWRCDMKNTKRLLSAIKRALNKLEKNDES